MEESLPAPTPLPTVPEYDLTERRPVRDEVVESIQRLALTVSAQELTATAVERRYRRLHADAIELFGCWEIALATALRKAVSSPRRVQRPPTPPISGDLPVAAAVPLRRPSGLRQPHPNAQRPVLVATSSGHLVRLGGDALTASETARPPGMVQGLGSAGARAIFDVAAASEVLGLTDGGELRRISPATVADAGAPIDPAHAADFVALFDLEDVAKAHRLVVATRRGKVRSVKVAALLDALEGESAWQACALDGDDVPVAAWLAERGDAVLLAASTGHVITFDLATLSTASRPATPSGRSERCGGVRGMQLKDGASVVGGVLAKPGLEVALITRRGKARRVAVDTFRQQARGGLGSPCTRLEDDDVLVAAVACHASTDVALFTDEGRALRLPATRLPLTERQGDGGASVIELDPGEAVAGAARMLPLAYASDAPNVFEI